MSIKTIVRERVFKSQSEAARVLNVTPSAVSKAKLRGSLDVLGIGKAKPVKYAGKQYKSISEAARDNGITRQAVSIYLIRQRQRQERANVEA